MEKFTLITGATGGLGNAFAYEFAKLGHNLVLSGTNLAKLDNIANRIEQEYPNIKVLKFICDLSDQQARLSFIEFLKENEVCVNYLVNNAGYIAEGLFLEHTDQEIIKVIRVNCEGTVDLTQKIIKIRDKSQELNIITVASMAGYYPMPYMAIYASTKAMLKNLMIAMHYELKEQGVNITTICPSGIPTSEAMKEAIKSQGLAGKITQSLPEQIAKIAIKANKKKKAVVVPKCINKIILAISNICGDKMLAKTTRRMWKKSYEKRQREGKL